MSHYGTEKYLSMIHTSQKMMKGSLRFLFILYANKPDE